MWTGQTLRIRRVVGPADVAALAVHIMTSTALTGATYDIGGGQPSTSPTSPSAREYTMRADMIPGGTLPDYELTDHTKTRRRLSELQGIDPMILVLSRGGFCPKDHQQHLELAASYAKIRVAYTQVVTICTDSILKTNEFRDSVGAQWTFLSDAGRKIQKDLDIQEYTDSYYDPMIPYTLVLKPGLVIYSIYNGYWFWGRPSFEDLRRDLREVTRQIRPDWDLTAPGLRGNWDAGGYTPEQAKTAALQVLPDILHYDRTQPATYPNGRIPTDDVYSLRFARLTNGKVPPSGLKPHDDLLAHFPYFGPPNPSR